MISNIILYWDLHNDLLSLPFVIKEFWKCFEIRRERKSKEMQSQFCLQQQNTRKTIINSISTAPNMAYEDHNILSASTDINNKDNIPTEENIAYETCHTRRGEDSGLNLEQNNLQQLDSEDGHYDYVI